MMLIPLPSLPQSRQPLLLIRYDIFFKATISSSVAFGPRAFLIQFQDVLFLGLPGISAASAGLAAGGDGKAD